MAFDRSFNLSRCHICVNHINYLADIVVADAWLPETVWTKTGISLLTCRTKAMEDRIKGLATRKVINICAASSSEVVESQTDNVVYGSFAYSYMNYLKSKDLFCPDIIGPNISKAKNISMKKIDKFHRKISWKRERQFEQRYYLLWWYKLMIEFFPLLSKYFKWFIRRILKLHKLTENKNHKPSLQLDHFH